MTTIVPTGGIEIRERGVLKAYLGSCVGLTIYDKKNHIGGIIHILLPEPISDILDSDKGYYATTGLPLLIEYMEDRGAQIKDMEACVAGGALVSPISPRDLDLNIGGRTLEITTNILRNKHIAIKKMETSGYFSCCLKLDASTGISSIEPIITQDSKKDLDFNPPSIDDIKQTITHVRPIPQIAIKIAKMLDDQDYDISTIAGEIKKDQVISAKILRLCNSPYVNPMTEITSIDHALIYLGNKTILKLTASAGSEEFFSQFGEGYSLCKGGLYQHALGTARLCEKLARLSGMLPPDVAYTAGLLHDIGKVVLDQYIADVQPLFYRQIQEEGKDSSIVERNIFNTDHTKTGELLAKNWNFPKTILDVVSFHHMPDIAETNKEMVYLVYVANLIVSRFQAGLDLSYIDPSILEGSLRILGLNSSQIPGIVNTLTYSIQPF